MRTSLGRTICVVLLCVIGIVLKARPVSAQSVARRAEPSQLSTGYYVVDNNDIARTPWRPNYFFQDTSYNRPEWTQIATGPKQGGLPGRYFFNPVSADTSNDAMAGPIYLGFRQPWNFYGANYDSLYISSNGFIGFRPYAEAISGTT